MTTLTWGELKERMKDADDQLPVHMMIRNGDGPDDYEAAPVRDAFVSEELIHDGRLIFVNEEPET